MLLKKNISANHRVITAIQKDRELKSIKSTYIFVNDSIPH